MGLNERQTEAPLAVKSLWQVVVPVEEDVLHCSSQTIEILQFETMMECFVNLLPADFGVSAKNTKTLQRRDSFIGTPYW